jgi:hypothetical protein
LTEYGEFESVNLSKDICGKKLFSEGVKNTMPIQVQNEMILQEVATLSSGTIASLTGNRQYILIDEAHQAFLQFVAQAETPYTSWIDAWNAYQLSIIPDTCPCCSGRIEKMTHYASLFTTGMCERCGGIVGNITQAQLKQHIFQHFENQQDGDEIRYFDMMVAYPDKISRVHGWFVESTKTVVQFG